MLNLLLFAALLLSAPQSGPTYTVETVRTAELASATVAGDHMLLLYRDGRATLVATACLSMDGGGNLTILGGAGNPSTVESTYTDKLGVTRRVITPCAGMSDEQCVERHKRACDAMLAVFPLPKQGAGS